ncbi:uncharacterized protein UV8b_02225 [Ustilaginoidea virens]|uniref:Uncharacterized protein n=1 Tax=Ustilaginoidea virens TaxID=1159556 RepID=A0A8E5HN12_USTVR|nr:uncharacterized protein UV8b_02225 [Ustilaginoidea virens]QUC17984.1 hypothetical protein UV8b_02225 [Ustilaginoidea virens]
MTYRQQTGWTGRRLFGAQCLAQPSSCPAAAQPSPAARSCIRLPIVDWDALQSNLIQLAPRQSHDADD